MSENPLPASGAHREGHTNTLLVHAYHVPTDTQGDSHKRRHTHTRTHTPGILLGPGESGLRGVGY